MSKPSYEIEYLNLFQPTITTFDLAMPSESLGAEYLRQVAELHPLQILRAELTFGGDSAHSLDHSLVIG